MGIKKKHVPGCTCCGCECTGCENSLSPEQFQVVLTGIVNISPVQCDDCTALSATHTLSRYFCGTSSDITHLGNLCEWRSSAISVGTNEVEPEDPCTYYVRLHIYQTTAGTYIVAVYISPGGDTFNYVKLWQKGYASAPACISFSSESIPHNSGVAGDSCNWGILGATCLVTAL